MNLLSHQRRILPYWEKGRCGRRLGRRTAAGLFCSWALVLVSGALAAQTVSIEVAGSSSLTEGSAFSVFVLRSDAPGATTVRIRTEDGSGQLPGSAAAVAGLDYEAVDTEIVLTNLMGADFVVIPSFDDDEVEPPEVFEVIVSVVSGGSVGGLDRVALTILDDTPPPPPSDGIDFTLAPPAEPWPQSPIQTFGMTVRAVGEPVAGLNVVAAVPAATRFDTTGSTPGWQCDPGPDEGGVCRFPVGDLAAGASSALQFSVAVVAGTPADFELLIDAGYSVESPDGGGSPALENRAHGSCTRTRQVDPGQVCQTFVHSLGADGHQAACTHARTTFDSLACCYSVFVLTNACEDTCRVTCDVPCDEVVIDIGV